MAKTITPAQFKARAEKAFRTQNPDAADIALEWTFVSQPCRYRSGEGSFRNGRFLATAPGFKPRTVVASVDLQTGKVDIR